MDVLFAAEGLVPAVGGAERFMVEALDALRERHSVRVVQLDPMPRPDPYWEGRRLRREEVGRRVVAALGQRLPDVVVTQLHASPAVIAAADRARIPNVLVLPSYESLCKLAFEAGADCRPQTRCRGCPAARALPERERRELERSREEHESAIRSATRLVALSRYVGSACREWCGRDADVVYPVGRTPVDAGARPDGPTLAPAVSWNRNKGAHVVEALDDVVAVEGDRPIDEVLRGAAIVIVPSQWPEPFGRTAFEAMAAGVPVLASRTGGLPEFVPAEQLVADFADPDAWRAAIAELREPRHWLAARERGLNAARIVLRQAPLRRFEELLLATAR